MARPTEAAGKLTKEALGRFPMYPLRAIARYLVYEHGLLFDNDIEKARAAIRYYTGRMGEANRLSQPVDSPYFRPPGVVTRMPQTWRKPRKAYNLSPGYWLILADIHIPYHEPKPLESAVKYGQDQKVTGILLNGDFQDCASVGFWHVEKRDFNKEMESVIDSLGWLKHEFPKQEIIYKPGNHEFRLPRYYVTKAPEMVGYPLAAMESVLQLEARDIDFLDYKQIVQAGKLPIFHGDELKGTYSPVSAARGLFNKTHTFAVTSHFHQTSEFSTTSARNELLTTWSTGCLCDLRPDYNPWGNRWNWGFALVNVEKNGSFEFINKRILPSGKVV